MVSGDRVSVHIHIVDRDISISVAGIIEVEDVRFGACRKNKGFLRSIGVELKAVQLRMRRVQSVIIHTRCRLDHGSGIAGYFRYDLGFSNLYVSRILLRVEDVLHGVAGNVALQNIHKGDDVVRIRVGKSQRFAVRLRTVARNSDRLLGDDLAHGKVRVGHNLVIRNCVAVLVHVVHRVAQGVPGPVGVHSGVRGDLGVPVKQISAVRRGVPAVEGISGLGRVRFRRRGLLVLGNCLGVFCRSPAVHHEGNSKGRRDPLGINRHVVAGHRVEDIGILQGGIGIPAAPGIVAVVDGRSAGRFRGNVVILAAADICLKVNIALCVQLRAAEVVLDLILRTIIVEVVYVARDLTVAFRFIADIMVIITSRTPRSIPFSVVERISMTVPCDRLFTGAWGCRPVSAVISISIAECGHPRGDRLVVPTGRITGGRTGMLGIAVDILCTKVVGIQADLGIGVLHFVSAVRLLQPVLSKSVIGRVAP